MSKILKWLMIELTPEQDKEIKLLFKLGIFSKEEFKTQIKGVLVREFFWKDKKAVCNKCKKNFWFRATEEIFVKENKTFCSRWCMERYQKI